MYLGMLISWENVSSHLFLMMVPVKPQSYCQEGGRHRCLLVERVSDVIKHEPNPGIALKCERLTYWERLN